MATFAERIKEIEDEIRKTKINKATETHVGRLKAKIARLKREQQDRIFSSSTSGGPGYDVKRSGDSSVAFIGLPSVGKSTLMNQLIGQELSAIAAYEFTTLEAIPGIMNHQGANIQVIDLPGIISGASNGKGRGKRVLSVARSADLLLVVLDVFDTVRHLEIILNELFYVGIRLNQSKPDIVITKTMRGGIAISTLKILTKITEKTIKNILQEYRLINADITIRNDITVEQLIDALEANRVYIPAIVLINKIDLADQEKLENLSKKFPEATLVSAESGYFIDELKDLIFNTLNLIKIFLRPQGEETDFEEPLIVREGCTVGEICDKLHRKFREEFKFARVWGLSARHSGQKVSLRHELANDDVLTIVRSTRG
ncbi:MAG: GTPase Obg [Candidatus Heimdallarchaeota archaeon LC_2]|nr:MAG: GTPase Obg [Candidatus Heimdallarchaeota archaeon LC_2]